MKKKSLLVGLSVAVMALTLGGCSLSGEEAQDWSSYQLKFDGENAKAVYVKLDLDADSDLNKDSSVKYTLEVGANEVYSYEYFASLDDLKSAKVESHDSDGNSAGGGVYYSDESVTFGDYEYTQLLNYYNPVSVTESGDYSEENSSVISTSYVYEVPETGEVILFGFEASYDGSIHEPEMTDLQLVEVIE